MQLGRLDAMNDHRRRLAARYDAILGDLPLGRLEQRPGARHVYHLYVVRTPRRNELAAFLKSRGIQTGVHYPVPSHRQPAVERLAAPPLIETERLVNEILTLPMSAGHTETEIEAVAAAGKKVFRSTPTPDNLAAKTPRPHPVTAGLEIGEDLRLVGGEHAAAVHHQATADPDAIDVLGRRVVDDVLDGIAQRRHAPRRRLPEHEIGGGAGGDAAEIVAAQRPRAAERGGVEDVGGAGGARVALDDLSADGGPSHGLHYPLPVGVGGARHVDAGAAIEGERLQENPAAHEDPRGVGDGAAGLRHDRDVPGRIAGPRRAADDDGVAEHRVLAEHTERLQPRDRRLAVTLQHHGKTP